MSNYPPPPRNTKPVVGAICVLIAFPLIALTISAGIAFAILAILEQLK